MAIGDTIPTRVTVTRIDRGSGRVTPDCQCRNRHGKPVIEGRAEVPAPRQRVRRAVTALPMVRLHDPGVQFPDLMDRARRLPPLPTAALRPCNALSLRGALDAEAAGVAVGARVPSMLTSRSDSSAAPVDPA